MWRSRYPRSSDPAVQAAQRQAARWRAAVGVAIVAGVVGVGLLAGRGPASELTAATDEISVATPELPA